MANNPNNTVQEWTPDALHVLNNMRNKIDEIRVHFGDDSKEYREATESLSRCLCGIPSWGGVVFKDAPYSLLVCGSLTIGIIFHSRKTESPMVPGQEILIGEWSAHS